MTDKKLPEDVERRFNEKFPGKVDTLYHVDKLIVKLYGVPFVSRCIETFVIIDREEARQFLADELAQAKTEERKRIVEMLEGMRKYMTNCCHTPNDSCDSDCASQEDAEKYNQTLDKVIEKLTKKD